MGLMYHARSNLPCSRYTNEIHAQARSGRAKRTTLLVLTYNKHVCVCVCMRNGRSPEVIRTPGKCYEVVFGPPWISAPKISYSVLLRTIVVTTMDSTTGLQYQQLEPPIQSFMCTTVCIQQPVHIPEHRLQHYCILNLQSFLSSS